MEVIDHHEPLRSSTINLPVVSHRIWQRDLSLGEGCAGVFVVVQIRSSAIVRLAPQWVIVGVSDRMFGSWFCLSLSRIYVLVLWDLIVQAVQRRQQQRVATFWWTINRSEIFNTGIFIAHRMLVKWIVEDREGKREYLLKKVKDFYQEVK